MGSTPQKKDITIEFDCLFRVNMGQCDFSSIMKVFLVLLPQLLEDFFQKVLVAFGEYEMAQDKKSFTCNSSLDIQHQNGGHEGGSKTEI